MGHFQFHLEWHLHRYFTEFIAYSIGIHCIAWFQTSTRIRHEGVLDAFFECMFFAEFLFMYELLIFVKVQVNIITIRYQYINFTISQLLATLTIGIVTHWEVGWCSIWIYIAGDSSATFLTTWVLQLTTNKRSNRMSSTEPYILPYWKSHRLIYFTYKQKAQCLYSAADCWRPPKLWL